MELMKEWKWKLAAESGGGCSWKRKCREREGGESRGKDVRVQREKREKDGYKSERSNGTDTCASSRNGSKRPMPHIYRTRNPNDK